MKTWLKILLALFIVGLIALFLGYKFIYNKPHPDFENIKPAYSVVAADFYSAFKSNKTESGKKYNGQVVELNGTLRKIETSDSTITVVFVFNQGMFGDEGIRCSLLKKYNDDGKKLQSGTPVKVKGYCTGFNDTDVILEQCCIVK